VPSLIDSVRNFVGYARCVKFDWLNGVDTESQVYLPDLTIPEGAKSYANRYMGTHPLAVKMVLKALPIDYKRFTLIDYGSGKGRVLLIGCQFPFQKVIGLELAPELQVIAERNIRNFRGKRQCKNIQSIQIDATLYEPEPVEAVYYFYFPFGESAMHSVIQKINRSLKDKPRDAFILSLAPFIRHVYEAADEFTLFKDLPRGATMWRSKAGVAQASSQSTTAAS